MRNVHRLLSLIVKLLVLIGLTTAAKGAQPLLGLVDSGGPREIKGAVATVLPTTAAEIDAAIAALQLQAGEVRKKCSAEKSTGTEGDMFAASGPDVRESERLLRDWGAALDQHARHLRMLKEVRRLAEERNTQEESWRGFPQPPSVLESEQLTDLVSARRLELRTAEMFLSIVEGEITRRASALTDRHKQLRLVLDKPRAAGVEELRRQWEIRLAERSVHAEEAAVEAAEIGRLVTWEALESLKRHIAFLERKVSAARARVQITRADVDSMLGAINLKKAAIQRMLEQALQNDSELRAKLADQSSNASRVANTQSMLSNCTPPPELALQVRNAELEASGHKVELYRGFLQLTEYAQNIWEDRLWATEHHSVSEIRLRQQRYSALANNLRDWKHLLEQSLSAGSELLLRQVLRVEDGRLSPEERSAAAQIAATLRDRTAVDLQAVGALAFTEDLAVRLHTELSQQVVEASALQKVGAAFETVRAALRHVWDIELYIAEDSVIAAGKKISVPRSITFGKVIIALGIFVSGLFAARYAYRFSRRIITETPARMIAAGIAVLSLVIAMSSVRIPWTVFAFMGGALAIGVGFGAQTLVNNFISGMILQGERTLRVGDIVEIDGERGKIMKIGFRQSLIARGDGSELLVPNSQFLEKKLVNWTLTDDLVRQTLAVNIAYGEPVEDAARLVRQAVAESSQIESTPAPQVLFEDFGNRALILRIIFWTHLCPSVDAGQIASELRHRIHYLLDDAGIAVAAPKLELTSSAFRAAQAG